MKSILENYKQDKLLFNHHLEIVDIKDCYRFDEVYPNGDWGLVDSYARDLNKYKNEVKNNFRSELFNMPTLARLSKRKLVIIDGNNRITAMKEIHKKGLIVAKVHNQMGIYEQADLFLDLNEKSSKVTLKQRFKAKVFMGDTEACEVYRILESFKIHVEGVIDGDIPIKNLGDILLIYRQGNLVKVLSTLLRAFDKYIGDEDEHHMIVTRNNLRAVNWFYKTFSDTSDEDTLVGRMQQKKRGSEEVLVTPMRLNDTCERARRFDKKGGASYVLEIYNYGLIGSKRLVPPPLMWTYTN